MNVDLLMKIGVVVQVVIGVVGSPSCVDMGMGIGYVYGLHSALVDRQTPST